MIEYLDPLINGILLGGLYGVVGIGLSMVFGIMRQVNLAHGDVMILSSYFSLFFLQVLGLHPLVPSFCGSAHVLYWLLHSTLSFQQGYAAGNRTFPHDLLRAFHYHPKRPFAGLYS